MIHLVRHAPPAAGPHVPPQDWPLSDHGRDLAAALVPAVPADAVLVSSPEPKAWQTLEPVGRPVARDPRLGEVRRPVERWDDDWRTRRRRYLEGAAPPGWEPRHAVSARYDAAAADALEVARSTGSTAVVLAGHGMAITCWLLGRGVVRPEHAGEFWLALRQPELLAVDLAARSWRRIRPASSTSGAR